MTSPKTRPTPSLWHNYLQHNCTILGYARSPNNNAGFRASIRAFLPATDHPDVFDRFLTHCIYQPDGCDSVNVLPRVAEDSREEDLQH